MTVALIAHDSKKELAIQLCIAYRSILSKHRIFASETTGRMIEESAGINVIRLMGDRDGAEQILSRVQCNEIDVLIFLRDPFAPESGDTIGNTILRLCDMHQVPYATNVATAEVLIMSLDRGDLDWRVYAHGSSII